MRRYFFVLLSCLLTTFCFGEEEQQVTLTPSTSEQLAALTGDSDALIGGLISPIDGHPSLREIDLVVQGAQPITLSRIYIPPFVPSLFGYYKRHQEERNRQDLYRHLRSTYVGWQFLPHQKLVFDSLHRRVLIRERGGATCEFSVKGSQTVLVDPLYAISNYSGGEVSGRSDPRNTKISVEANGERIAVRAPDGTLYTYVRAEMVGASKHLFLLHKEILPNGKVVRYSYGKEGKLSCVESLDPEEHHLYASLYISDSLRDGCRFIASSGIAALYRYEQREFYSKIKEGSWFARQKEKVQGLLPPILQSVRSSSYRQDRLEYDDYLLLTSYSGKDFQFTADYAPFGDYPHYKVHKLNLPVGANDALQAVWEIDYQPPIPGKKEGLTRAKRTDGSSIVYHFSKELLPTSIDYFGQDGQLKRQKVFSWDEGRLTSIGTRDGEGLLLTGKLYELDPFGNPALETVVGDLTGSGALSSYKIRREFSQDGRNLLLREEQENGKVLSFSYLSDTNLVTRKLTQDRGQILRREFSRYDDSHNLIETLSDDGSGEDADDLTEVTQRTITRYILRQEAPFLHMPEWIEERYLEEGAERLLKRQQLTYDRYGNIACEAVYDANDALAYTIEKEYNNEGDLLSETNPSGQKAVYGYTERGYRDFETTFSGRVQKSRSYDASGRLREEIASGDDGTSHLTRFEYDFHEGPIRKIDSFGNLTAYSYEAPDDQIEAVHFPSIAGLDGGPLSVATYTLHDALGRKVEETNANGNTTTYRYNAYGSVAEVNYSDGGRESYCYERDGRLASSTDRDGLTTVYQRDLLDRVLSKSYLSSSGELLAQETFTYSGFNLLSETDREGNRTEYLYDGAGRKIREDRSGRLTDFSYDTLGRLSTITLHNGANTLVIHYTRDLEGRLLEESKSDSFGNLLYKISHTYDGDGNRSSTTRYINGKPSTELVTFDPFGRLIEKRSPNAVTRVAYDESYVNGLGQRVLQTMTTAPLGMVTLETRDALNHPVKEERLDAQRLTLSYREMSYDPAGNLTDQRDAVFAEGQLTGTQSISYTYTPTGRLESWTQGEGGTTSYTYLPSGKIETKQLPDGVVLSYRYHPLGYLSHLASSDGQIAHTFRYNRLGDLTYAADENQGIAIEREVDPFGNVIQESLPHVPSVAKRYDALNRLTSLRIEGVGEIAYRYDPLFLREVIRSSANGQELYRHSYEAYDEDGNLLIELLPGDLGQVIHKTGPEGLKAAISSPYFSENYCYDAARNLTERVSDREATRYAYDGLAQLSQEKGQSYRHDSLYNRVQKNGVRSEFNDSNQLLSFGANRYSYHCNGNQLTKGEFQLAYDSLNRLVEAVSEDKRLLFSYDPLGRRLGRTLYRKGDSRAVEKEYYVYDGEEEIGSFSRGELKSLRVVGLNGIAVAIELGGGVFAPMVDAQRNIRRLVDPRSGSIVGEYEFTAFGEEVWRAEEGLYNPWCFASKRLDPDLGIVHFGKREYDPETGRWLTQDPAGFLDAANLYQYVFNNPFRYCDPDGQFVFVIPLLVWGAGVALPTVSMVVSSLAYSAVTAAILYGGYKASQALNDRCHDPYRGPYTLNRGKKAGGVDESLPEDPFSHPDWEEISHPKAAKKGHYEFKDKKTGKVIEYDKGKPDETGHKAHDHYHRPNPNSKGKGDEYLDSKGRPVRAYSEPSHLYPPEWVWWK